VVESSYCTIIEPSSINTVQEVVKKTVKRKKPKSKQLFPFYVNIEKCTNRLIGKLKMPLVKGRCIANRLIKWMLNYRKHNIMLCKTFKHLKKIINKKINHSVVVLNDQLDYLLLRFILGESRHSK
jgi:hypothetical protein